MNVQRVMRDRRCVQTIIIYYCYFVFVSTDRWMIEFVSACRLQGFGSNLIPSALIDITEITETSVNDISSYSFVASSVSYCCCSLIGGYFGQDVDRHIHLFAAMLLSGLARVAIPLSRSLWDYTVIMILVGVSNAGIDIGANSWLLNIWSHRMSNIYMQGMHFFWALGSAISPLVAEPFLSKTLNQTVTIFNQTTKVNETSMKQVTTDSLILYPFSFCAFLHLVSCIILIVLYCVSSSNERSTREEEEELMEREDQWEEKSPSKTFIIVMAGAVIGLETGMEVNTFNYLTVFAVGHKYSKSTSAFLLSALTICFTISRGVSTIAASRVPIEWILCSSLSIISFAIALLTLLPDAGHPYLWIGFCLIGFGFGPFYAATFSYLSQHIIISTSICGIFIFLSSLSVIVNDLTVGKLIVHHLYVYNLFNVISCIFTVIFFVSLRIITRNRTKRTDQKMEGRSRARTSSWTSKVVKVSED